MAHRERPSESLPLAHVALGDIVALPDGRRMTVRCRADLGVPLGSMGGFVIAGELEALLSIPACEGVPVGLYRPLQRWDEYANRAKVVAEGVARYWAPHLPALRGAMGELGYQILDVRGQIHPIVAVRRGEEVILFVRISDVATEHLWLLYMERSPNNDVDVARHAGYLTPLAAPAQPVLIPAEGIFEKFARPVRV